MLTDTTFWSDLMGEHRRGVTGPAMRFIAAHRAHNFAVSIVTWGELAEVFQTQTALEHVLRNVSVMPLPKQVAWEASRVQRALAQRIGENDAWIAGTALIWGKRLVTRDAAFQRVPRLRTIAY